MHIASVGIDLGKTIFHLVALDDHGSVVIKRKFSRKQLLVCTANLASALVGIEACSGAHFIGAALREQGQEVRLIPAQFVKPFLNSHGRRGRCARRFAARKRAAICLPPWLVFPPQPSSFPGMPGRHHILSPH